MSKKEYNQQYYENNKDRHREKVRLYYQQNREKVLLRKALVRHLAEVARQGRKSRKAQEEESDKVA